mgnify:CR=1 FL=1
MTIREEIDAQFPIRKTTAQKRAFEKWVMAKMREMGYRPYVDGMNRKDKLRHRNIVAGDPQNATTIRRRPSACPICASPGISRCISSRRARCCWECC